MAPKHETISTSAMNQQVSVSRHAQATGTATSVPQVPGAIGEYPAPPAVAMKRAIDDVRR